MMLVFSEHTSTRLNYTLKFIFNELLGIEWEHTDKQEDFESYSGPKLYYSSKLFANAIRITPSALLFEGNIRPLEIQVFDFENTKAFFKTDSSDFPFDIFAASFYLLSRYEEYLPFEADLHGRFEAHHSLAFKNNFLQQPVINSWAAALLKVLILKFPSLKFSENKYSFTPTIDVDNVYAYAGKGFFRTTGAYLKSLIKLDFRIISERTQVLLGLRSDPFDGYSLQKKLAEKYKLNLIYFLLFARRSKNDPAISPGNHKYKDLISFLATFSRIGLHPSYSSSSESGKIITEKENLESASGKKITRSRQHFLKLKFPNTYQKLIESGIREDYSMGYASQPGFRAGTCSPFSFFDLSQNQETLLKLFPFAVMDVTFSDYKKISPKEGLQQIEQLVNEVKKVNGYFISVWHDRSFSDSHYPGWGQAFEEMIKLANG